MVYPSETLALLGQDFGNNKDARKMRGRNNGLKDSKKSGKLGTFDGVFLPTALNVLSILMFLRFGFIVGQMGILGTFLLLVMSYTIDMFTVMSVSAISTNGTVKGGGAYYMISRSLGPEFGGSIGIIFYIGQILNASLNVVGFIEPLTVNFGRISGDIANILPVGYWWQLMYSTILLFLCTAIALIGSRLVSKTALFLFIMLTLSTLSIPLSTAFVKPFYPPGFDIMYTGPSWTTFKENLLPKFTSGAAGSVQPPGQPETFRNLFGIFFPATAGIFAGASMSGELRKPSKSIPRGTINGLIFTFIFYLLVITSLGVSIPRDLLHKDIKVIQTVNIYGLIIILGEFSTSLFSVIMGVVGAANILGAIANDRIIPGLSVFSTIKKSSTQATKARIMCILVTWLIAQVFLFADINQIATFITMAFLMTFIVTNLACFLLKIGSAPNFRPSFKYFNSKTAFLGCVSSIIAMFIVDGISATLIIAFLMFLIMAIHYMTPPLKFGDISQLLIYHQVRKYLLRLKLQMSTKYWRPQILLLCDDPRSCWNLIGFCNHLKKGGLYILGHVVIINDGNNDGSTSEFGVNAYQELKSQRNAWVKLRDISNIKAFVQIAAGPTLPWGVRNVFLGSGLGGMRPNITVLGFYDFVKHGVQLPLLPSFKDKQKLLSLPTDSCRKEQKVSIKQWVQIVEDLIVMQATVAVAANFNILDLPKLDKKHHSIFTKAKDHFSKHEKKYIDLYPIQMSSIDFLENGKSILSTNFDTYTLILQLGAILVTVPEWKYTSHVLRVIVFVELEEEIEDERKRLAALLESLRIDADIKVIHLGDGSLDTYNYMVKGYTKTATNKKEYSRVDQVLKNDQWWANLCNARETIREIEKLKLRRQARNASRTKESVFFNPLNFGGGNTPVDERPFSGGVRNRRYTLSNLHDQGLSLSFNMKSQHGDQFFKSMPDDSSSSSSESEKEEDSSAENSDYSFARDLGHNTTGNNYLRPELMSRASKLKQSEGLGSGSGHRSSDQLSIRSSRSNLRPNFLSYKIPEAQIQDNDDSGGEDDNKPSIGFVEDSEGSDKDDDNTERAEDTKHEELTVEKVNRVASNKDYFSIKPVGSELTKKKSDLGGMKSPSILTNKEDIMHKIQTPQFLEAEDDEEANDSGDSNVDPKDPRSKSRSVPSSASTSRSDAYKGLPQMTSAQATDAGLTRKQLQEELKNISFNDLPAKGQHLVLNEIMRRNSPKDSTDIIFSTLPSPTLGAHLDEEDAFEYTNNLAVWLDGLSPIFLLNSQSVTVTTAL